MQSLNIRIFDNAAEAIAEKFVYSTPEYIGVTLKQAVVVRQGTVEGNSTVDLILEDEKGQKYVAMVTGNLLRSVPTQFK